MAEEKNCPQSFWEKYIETDEKSTKRQRDHDHTTQEATQPPEDISRNPDIFGKQRALLLQVV